MKVIKEGKLPEIKKRTLRGTCTNCGCVVEDDYYYCLTPVSNQTIACPTSWCYNPIYLLPKYPENIESNYV